MRYLPLENFRSPAAVLLYIGTTVIGIAIDLATKVWAFKTLAVSMVTLPSGRVEVAESRTYAFIPDWLHFQVTVNYGAVFGIGQGKGWLFLLISLVAIVFLTYLFATSDRQRFYQCVLGLLLAGVLGNMYDRLVYGYVRDMIYALPNWTWPGTWTIPLLNYPGEGRAVFPWIFNVADSLLCVGVALLAIHSVYLHFATAKAAKAGKQPAPTEA